MKVRRRTVEHIFGTLKHWMGSAHFLTKTLAKVRTEMSLHVLALRAAGKRTVACRGNEAPQISLAGRELPAAPEPDYEVVQRVAW
jgi:hypothetical protein